MSQFKQIMGWGKRLRGRTSKVGYRSSANNMVSADQYLHPLNGGLIGDFSAPTTSAVPERLDSLMIGGQVVGQKPCTRGIPGTTGRATEHVASQ